MDRERRNVTDDTLTDDDALEEIGKPQQPVTKERQHMPDTGNTPVPPGEDVMEEARDGFMDRYPPLGSDDEKTEST